MGGFLGAFGLYLASFYFQLGVPTETSRWCSELWTKKKEIAARMKGPRLLLVGGSSVLFSINARQIERQIGISTVNLGTHAALGTEYLLEQTRQIAKPGDTVALILEYELFGRAGNAAWNDELYLDYLLARDPDFLNRRPLAQRAYLMMSVPLPRLKRGLKNRWSSEQHRTPVNIYDAAFTDDRGDQTGNDSGHKPAIAPKIKIPHRLLLHGFRGEDQGFAVVKRFCDWARANQVHLVATFPAIAANPAYSSSSPATAPLRIQNSYEKEGVPLLEVPGDLFYDPTEFFDTVYHMTEAGAKRRTEHFISALESVLEQRRSK